MNQILLDTAIQIQYGSIQQTGGGSERFSINTGKIEP